MDIVGVGGLVAGLVAAGGVIYNIRRTSERRAEQHGQLMQKIQEMDEKLDNTCTFQKESQDDRQEIRETCAETRGGYEERFRNNEQRLDGHAEWLTRLDREKQDKNGK